MTTGRPMGRNQMTWWGMLALVATLTACGGRQSGGRGDPVELLRQGRYAEARALARKETPLDQRSRAIVALTLVAEAPTPERGKKAVATLTQEARNVRAAAVASEMLDIAFELPPTTEGETSLSLAEVALGATCYGPYAANTQPSITVGAASRELALAVLERTAIGLSDISTPVEEARLLAIWNACFSLSGGAFESSDNVFAWRLYKAIATLGIFVFQNTSDSDFAKVLVSAAVNVVVANPDIAVPVRCDLGSPFDGLKKALMYNRSEMYRLENAVKDAAGCTRGDYAPAVERYKD